jgi:hypothetical protein
MRFLCRKKMERFTSPHASWISPVFFALAFYTLGASFMDSFAMYHTWKFVGPSEFVEMHKASGSRIVNFLVIPTLIMTVFLILQFWHRPKAVSSRLVRVALICTIIPWLSSIFIQIPIQVRLDHGKDDALLQWLIASDWIRVIPTIVLAGVVFVMIRRSIY